MAWSWDRIDWPQTLTAMVGMATLVQAFAAVVMMRSLKHSAATAKSANENLELNERTAERQLRAYVHVEKVTVQPVERGKPLVATAYIRNNGQTPAYNLRIYQGVAILTAAELQTHQPISGGQLAEEWPLGGGCSTHGQSYIPWEQWAPLADKVLTGEEYFAISGTISYDDVFGTTRMTKFVCFRDSAVSNEEMYTSTRNAKTTGNSAN